MLWLLGLERAVRENGWNMVDCVGYKKAMFQRTRMDQPYSGPAAFWEAANQILWESCDWISTPPGSRYPTVTKFGKGWMHPLWRVWMWNHWLNHVIIAKTCEVEYQCKTEYKMSNIENTKLYQVPRKICATYWSASSSVPQACLQHAASSTLSFGTWSPQEAAWPEPRLMGVCQSNHHQDLSQWNPRGL